MNVLLVESIKAKVPMNSDVSTSVKGQSAPSRTRKSSRNVPRASLSSTTDNARKTPSNVSPAECTYCSRNLTLSPTESALVHNPASPKTHLDSIPSPPSNHPSKSSLKSLACASSSPNPLSINGDLPATLFPTFSKNPSKGSPCVPRLESV